METKTIKGCKIDFYSEKEYDMLDLELIDIVHNIQYCGKSSDVPEELTQNIVYKYKHNIISHIKNLFNKPDQNEYFLTQSAHGIIMAEPTGTLKYYKPAKKILYANYKMGIYSCFTANQSFYTLSNLEYCIIYKN